jgi:hypothetical protein
MRRGAMLKFDSPHMRRLALYFFLISPFILAASSHGQTIASCPKTKGYERVHRIHGYVVRLLPGVKDSDVDLCRGSVAVPGGAPVIFTRALALWIDGISGNDVNQDGIPDVVFGGYSIADGCCFEYTIVSLAKRPTLLRKIHNQVPLKFQKEEDGSVILRGGDGAFDLFLLPHPQSVIPEMTLRLKGKDLSDISAQYKEDYDKKIANARSELTPAALEKFRSADFHQKLLIDQAETVHRVLEVVLNYLYSGREAEAWEALEEMWPPADKSRVRALIEERRLRGLLAQVSGN